MEYNPADSGARLVTALNVEMGMCETVTFTRVDAFVGGGGFCAVNRLEQINTDRVVFMTNYCTAIGADFYCTAPSLADCFAALAVDMTPSCVTNVPNGN